MKSLELFAGIGGLSLAAEMAGIETIAFCERDEFAQKVLNKHWPNVPIFDDVCTLTKQSLGERGVEVGTIDIVSGGFPCQPFSLTGEKRGRSDERDLWGEMFRIIKEIQPTWVVGENVANFANMELKRTLDNLESEGYETRVYIIPAEGVGAWHKRERTFILAYSHSNFERSGEKQGQSEGDSTGQCVGHSSFMESIGLVGGRTQTANLRDWSTEPTVGRMANGVPGRVDRLRGLGNAVVPAQAYPIFKAIADSYTY